MKINAPKVWRYNQQRRQYLDKVGKVVGWSVVRNGPEGMEKRTPYVVALIEVGTQRVIGQVVDVDLKTLAVGMKVVGVLRRLFEVDAEAVIVYGIKWRAIE
jgi:uncharacterized OB-fold protein